MEYKIEKSDDGTKKIIFKEGYIAVIIPTKDNKNTLCLSCQVGCPVKCKFCHTGKLGFKRNLTTEEMREQVNIAKSILGKEPTTVVFMGMGEPTLNLTNVLKLAEELHEINHLSYNHITISTSCLDNINYLLNIKFNVALSLHSVFDKKRKQIIKQGATIRKILSFAKRYCSLHKNKYLMIEYTPIKDFNDTDKDIKKLIAIKWPKNTLFNIIEFNPIDNFERSNNNIKIKDAIMNAGWKCFIRLSRGSDIKAACGMLDFN